MKKSEKNMFLMSPLVLTRATRLLWSRRLLSELPRRRPRCCLVAMRSRHHPSRCTLYFAPQRCVVVCAAHCCSRFCNSRIIRCKNSPHFPFLHAVSRLWCVAPGMRLPTCVHPLYSPQPSMVSSFNSMFTLGGAGSQSSGSATAASLISEALSGGASSLVAGAEAGVESSSGSSSTSTSSRTISSQPTTT